MIITILKSAIAKIGKKKVKVEQAKGKGKQEIFYIVNGKKVSANKFHEMALIVS